MIRRPASIREELKVFIANLLLGGALGICVLQIWIYRDHSVDFAIMDIFIVLISFSIILKISTIQDELKKITEKESQRVKISIEDQAYREQGNPDEEDQKSTRQEEEEEYSTNIKSSA